jgi:hypothetical protein
LKKCMSVVGCWRRPLLSNISVLIDPMMSSNRYGTGIIKNGFLTAEERSALLPTILQVAEVEKMHVCRRLLEETVALKHLCFD